MWGKVLKGCWDVGNVIQDFSLSCGFHWFISSAIGRYVELEMVSKVYMEILESVGGIRV